MVAGEKFILAQDAIRSFSVHQKSTIIGLTLFGSSLPLGLRQLVRVVVSASERDYYEPVVFVTKRY
jgi:hypothetical protein